MQKPIDPDIRPSDVGYTEVSNNGRIEIWRHTGRSHVTIIYKSFLHQEDLLLMTGIVLKLLKDTPKGTCIHLLLDYRKGNVFSNADLKVFRACHTVMRLSCRLVKIWRIATPGTMGWGGYMQVTYGTTNEDRLFDTFRDAWDFLQKHYPQLDPAVDVMGSEEEQEGIRAK